MTEKDYEPNPNLLQKGEALYSAEFNDALSVLGVQSEILEIDLRRNEEGRPIPAWSDDEAFDRVISPQRASSDELAEYASRGIAFAQDMIQKLGEELRDALCLDGKVRDEILELGDDIKSAIKYIAGVVTGMLVAIIPAVVAAAIAAIATTLAVIILKNNLQKYCLTSALDLEG
jgi:hypothetical protein